MEERLKVEPGLDKNVKLISSRLKDDAKDFQAFLQQEDTTSTRNSNSSGEEARNRTRDAKPRSGSGNNHGKGRSKTGPENVEKNVICLDLSDREKGIQHTLKDCRACPEEEKTTILCKYMHEGKRGDGWKAQLVGQKSQP